jgi:hypothetical protein
MKSFVGSVLVFAATLCDSNAQDIRVRIGSYFGGGTVTCVDETSNNFCPGGTLSPSFPATTHVTAVTKDVSGNIYIAGDTNAASRFPITSNAYSKTVAHKEPFYVGPTLSSDSFVAKFGPGGNLIWSTYLGVPTQDFTATPDAPTPIINFARKPWTAAPLETGLIRGEILSADHRSTTNAFHAVSTKMPNPTFPPKVLSSHRLVPVELPRNRNAPALGAVE